MVSEQFDPYYYNRHKHLVLDTYYTQAFLMKDFGQINQYFISQTTTTFKDNVFYDDPFSPSPQFVTYMKNHDENYMFTYTDERAYQYLGFVNYRLV